MKIGDWIVFGDMGAYTIPTEGRINGSFRRIHTMASREIWLVFFFLETNLKYCNHVINF